MECLFVAPLPMLLSTLGITQPGEKGKARLVGVSINVQTPLLLLCCGALPQACKVVRM